jgi:outer membrane protein assembly factor BamA
VREEYARRGLLRAEVNATPVYDDTEHTVSYSVEIQEGRPFKFGKLVITGISIAAERRLRDAWPMGPGSLFDKAKYEGFLTQLQAHHELVFGDLPLHYDEVGHWMQTDESSSTVDVLLDFK